MIRTNRAVVQFHNSTTAQINDRTEHAQQGETIDQFKTRLVTTHKISARTVSKAWKVYWRHG